jgi:hypothetical protein
MHDFAERSRPSSVGWNRRSPLVRVRWRERASLLRHAMSARSDDALDAECDAPEIEATDALHWSAALNTRLTPEMFRALPGRSDEASSTARDSV